MHRQRSIPGRVLILAATVQFLGAGANQAALPVKAESFDDDPLWVSSNNQTSPNNYGFTNTSHITGASAGEVGGTIGSASLSYYGDAAADGLTLYTNLVASGKLTIDTHGGFSGAWGLGWFDRTQSGSPTFLGLRFVDPLTGASPVRLRVAYVRPGGDVNEDVGGTMTLDSGKDYDWTFSYDPTGNGGFGTVSATITGIDVVDSESTTWNLHPADKPMGSRFNTFGIVKIASGSGTPEFFIDNLTYTIPEPSSLAIAGLLLVLSALRKTASA